MGSDSIKLTECYKVEWGEKCHSASDILFEWPDVFICYFIDILFYIGKK